MRYLIVQSGIVTNAIEAEASYAASIGAIQSDVAQAGWTYDAETFFPPPAPEPTTEDVIAERERRLTLGFDFDFQDARGTHRIATTPTDLRKWLDEVTPIAQAFISVGQPAGGITISTATGIVTITALEWQQILLAAGAWRQPIYQASFALEASSPIPNDFADDKYWP